MIEDIKDIIENYSKYDEIFNPGSFKNMMTRVFSVLSIIVLLIVAVPNILKPTELIFTNFELFFG